MKNQLVRTAMLIGHDNISKLKNARVAVFGAGGVGCAAIEALARASVGAIDIFDNDCYSETNLNRQLYAIYDTIGKSKVDVAKQRIAMIDDSITVNPHPVFVTVDYINKLDITQFDYIIDAIDTVSSKIALCIKAYEQNVKIISCMGTGNKLDPTRFEVSDIYKTEVCPLAKVMRNKLKQAGVKKLKVVFSKELPMKPLFECENDGSLQKRQTPASISFVPPVAGFILASEVIKDLTEIK